MSTYKVKGISDAKILYDDSGLQALDIPYGNTFGISPEYDTLTFEGDGEQTEEYSNLKLTGTIGGDKLDTDVLEKLYGKSAVTSGAGITGVESKRYYMGANEDLSPSQVGFRVDLLAIDDSDESEATIRLTVFKAKVKPLTPSDVSNNDKWSVNFEWTAERTTTDIADEALPGVPSGGASYAISILA